MKHFLEEYYIELNLIKKPEVEEDDGLSGDEISDKFVSVEDREEQIQLSLASQTMATKQIQLLRLINRTMDRC